MSEKRDDGFMAVPAHREAERLYGVYEKLSVVSDRAPLVSGEDGNKKIKKKKSRGRPDDKKRQPPATLVVAGVYMRSKNI